MLLLSILFCYIIYLNLPDSLNGLVTFKPVPTAGPIDRFFKLGTIGVSLILIAVRWSVVSRVVKTTNPGLVALLALVPLSVLWSIDPPATLLRFITLASIVLLCFAISLAPWNPRRFQGVVIPPLMFVVISSLLIGLVNRDAVMEIGEGISLQDAWKGVTHSKNQFGMMAGTAVVVCFNRWLSREGNLPWAIAGTITAFLGLALSRSNTSFFATLLALLMMVMVLRVPIVKSRYTTHVVIGVCATIVVYQLAILGMIPGAGKLLSPIMQMTGKDMTFSSRTGIWDIVKQNIAAHPWLGSGYGAYWNAENPNAPSHIFTWLMYFYPTESHNGYLEIRSDLGAVGLSCLLLYLSWFVWQGLQYMQVDRNQATLFLALLAQQLVINMSESDWLSRSNTCAVLTLATTCMSRALAEHARQRTGQTAPAKPAAPVPARQGTPLRTRFAVPGRSVPDTRPGRTWRGR